MKMRLQCKCFPVNFAKLLRTHILQNIYKRTAASDFRNFEEHLSETPLHDFYVV